MIAAADVVDAQLAAYNAQDLDAFCACFADECVIAEFNGPTPTRGIGELRDRDAALFGQYPLNKARVANRIAVGDVVIDHEEIVRAPGVGLRLVMIYTVRDGRIARADVVRESKGA